MPKMVLAVPEVPAETKGDNMEKTMEKIEPAECVARPFAQFDKGWFLLTVFFLIII